MQRKKNVVPSTLVVSLLIGMILLSACAAPATEAPAAAEAPAEATAAPAKATEAPEEEIEEPTEAPEAVDSFADLPEIVIAVAGEPPTLHAFNTGHNEVNTVGMRNVFESLIDRDPVTSELIPQLATSWEQVDELRWRFQLRKGVVFHDGSPFNADAAAAAFNLVFDRDAKIDHRGEIATQYGSGIETTAEVVNEYTIDLVTAEPDPILARRMFHFHIPSMAAKGVPDSLNETPVGTGPYRFVEFVRGQHIILEANPDWWGLTDPAAGGAINFSRATFLFRPETSVRVSMVETGEANLSMNINPEDCQALNATDGTKCVGKGSADTIFVRFDANDPASIMTDLRVRQALAHALDWNLLLDTILLDIATPAAQIVGPAVDGHLASLEAYAYDPDLSRSLLAEYVADGGQIVPVTFAFQQERFPRIRELADAMAAMWKEVGLTVEVLEQEPAVFGAEFQPSQHPPNRIMMHTHGNELGDLGGTLTSYFGAPPDHGCWCVDEEMWAMIEASRPLSGADRTAAFHAIMQRIYDNSYFTYGGYVAFQYGVSENLDWTPPLEHFFLLKYMELN
ncbi:MAG: ABC transporter substrate-binding protein [Proteobacteria bacterium]|nr:ABC transporter substrate-binding protein [Pseudomonadota bacterium]